MKDKISIIAGGSGHQKRHPAGRICQPATSSRPECERGHDSIGSGALETYSYDCHFHHFRDFAHCHWVWRRCRKSSPHGRGGGRGYDDQHLFDFICHSAGLYAFC